MTAAAPLRRTTSSTIKHLVSLLLLLCALLTACSTQHNTAGSRWWQSFVTRYNVYYNAATAYEEGEEAQRNGLREDYTRRLPVFEVGYPKQAGLGKSNFERTIEKCEKAIRLHSIKRKPKMKVGSRTSPSTKAFLSRKEYNPFLKNAWLLMGKAQFQQGDFLAAASTFGYITRFYDAEPEVTAEARVWLIRCDVALGWLYDAEDAAQRIAGAKMSKRVRHERDLSLAALLLAQKRTKDALPYLENAAREERNRFRKARLYYLLAQSAIELRQPDRAFRALNRCLAQNPTYEMAFHARMLQTEVLTTPQTAQRMLARLHRMLKSPNNKDYLDQVYYAIGNVHLLRRDTAQAIEAYETGRGRATQATPEKGQLLRKLGDLYWNRQRFDKAQPCYAEAVGLMDKDDADYAELVRRSEVLDKLVPFTSVIFEQDSLLALAKMPEDRRNAIIDHAIEMLKKQEAAERRNKNDSLRRARAEATGEDFAETTMTAAANATPNNDKSWYFYNSNAVRQGKQAFARQWGKRRNEDDWQRTNRSMLADQTAEAFDYAAEDSIKKLVDARRDSLSAKGISGNELENALSDYSERLKSGKDNAPETGGEHNKKEDAKTDPHSRAFYLAQIPLSPEARAEAHKQLSEALFGAAEVEHEALGDFALAEKTLRRLVRDYPDFDKTAEAYYRLFLLARRRGKTAEAERYRSLMADRFADSPLTRIITDPDFERNARYGRELEDSLYAATYNAYLSGHTAEVVRNFERSSRQYPSGLNRPKFMLVHALARIASAPRDTLIREFSAIAKDYPKNDVAEMAAMMAKGLQEGRTPERNGYRPGSLWERRLEEAEAETAAEGQSRTLSDERNVPFVFVVAYPTDSLPDDRILYELARFNFSHFMSRGLDIAKQQDKSLTQFRVSGFVSFADAHRYAQTLHAETSLRTLMKGARTLIISRDNLRLLGTIVSYDDYRNFYDKHFAPLKIKDDLPTDFVPESEQPRQIYEDELPTKKQPNLPERKKEDEEEYEYAE